MRSAVAVLRTLFLLAPVSCAVGPDFHPPQPPSTNSYTAEKLPTETRATDVAGGNAQRFRIGEDLNGEWWTLFGSNILNSLIHEAMLNYPDIAAQQAALRGAQEFARVQEGQLFPQVVGAAGFQREKVSGTSIAPGFPDFITSVYAATVEVSYTFDLFGGERRALEELRARASAQYFILEASYLTLTSNIAAAVVQLASLTDQIAATREIIDIESKELDFITRRFESGSQTQADVFQQQSNLASVRATLPELLGQRSAVEHELAVLTGRLPHDAPSLRLSLSDLKLPQDLPVSLSSSLISQRPDLRAHAEIMHEASAAIGVATADLLPKLTLIGSVGRESVDFSRLLKPGSDVWGLATNVVQPLFNGGALRARHRAAIDTYERAYANYRLAVLKAFQNVADSLTALDNDAQSLNAYSDALDAAGAGLALIKKQYDSGATSYVSLLTAQQAYQQTRLAYVKSVAKRYVDTITLFQALGGGWWNRTAPGTTRTAELQSAQIEHTQQ